MLKRIYLIIFLCLFLMFPTWAAADQSVPAYLAHTTHHHSHKHARGKKTHTKNAQSKKAPRETRVAKKKRHKIKHRKHELCKQQPAQAEVESDSDSSSGPFGFVSAATKRLLTLVNDTISNLTYNHYKMGGTYFNTNKGAYEVDCSSYVDHLLSNATPHAYRNVKNWTRSEKPTSEDYFSFFKNLPRGNIQDGWYRVGQVQMLRPGDILVFRNKLEDKGHVMIVVNTPSLSRGLYNAFQVRVSDSAPSGHSQDTRPRYESGVGIGTLLLKVDLRTGHPYAYAWKLGSSWRYDIDFAMARPMYA